MMRAALPRKVQHHNVVVRRLSAICAGKACSLTKATECYPMTFSSSMVCMHSAPGSQPRLSLPRCFSTKVLFSSHPKFEGPVDKWLLTQVSSTQWLVRHLSSPSSITNTRGKCRERVSIRITQKIRKHIQFVHL